MLSEVIGAFIPHYPSVTNAELAASFGADLLLVNLFDVMNPSFEGVDRSENVVERLKELTGRPVGVNLEPVDEDSVSSEDLEELPRGRIASERTLKEAKRLGFDFVCLTGNPKTGVSNEAITKAVGKARSVLGTDGLIIAGKMHGAGVANESGERILSEEAAKGFVEAGADIILMPSPGTVPGMTVESVSHLVRVTHEAGALAMLTTGTSQEGADAETIRQIAVASKMAGGDLFHIGDAGYHGVAIPENIMTYSIAIRGKRHTYVRMASSVRR